MGLAVRDSLRPLPGSHPLIAAVTASTAPSRKRRPPARAGLGPATKAQVQELLGYRFVQPALLEAALTHGSVERRGPGDHRRAARNQRLEFLGDRVLALAMAHLLLETYPDADEGALTSRSQILVSTTVLAEIADEIGLVAHLRADASAHDRSSGPSPKMRADLCEALIGAVFEDGGLDPAVALVRRLWEPRIAAMVRPPRDPKMALQEWALERSLPLPAYLVRASDGPPHAPTFTIEVAVQGYPPASAEGASKRSAEQAAAAVLIARLAAS